MECTKPLWSPHEMFNEADKCVKRHAACLATALNDMCVTWFVGPDDQVYHNTGEHPRVVAIAAQILRDAGWEVGTYVRPESRTQPMMDICIRVPGGNSPSRQREDQEAAETDAKKLERIAGDRKYEGYYDFSPLA